ncbi:hypothetical protein [Sphingomonas fennica]|uniref:Uncharacterized protein n=1 Tax=Edaphosphingomonas fennica TaxID=114404 RepID=A0A2T4HXA1_9SPHN|nr:hypothetical protein [Sphingomonas fennica]PTD20433.1 hypothetical protein CV103_11385 [Sphingomonas fennica]
MATEPLRAESACHNRPRVTPALNDFEMICGERPFGGDDAVHLLSNAYSLVRVIQIAYEEAHVSAVRGAAIEIGDNLVAGALAGIGNLIALAALMAEERGR